MSGRELARLYPVNGLDVPESEMTTTTDTNPPHGEQDPALAARAAASLGALFKARRSLAADLEEAGRAHTHLEQERQREADALQAQSTAEQHAAGVTARLDGSGQRFAGFTAGVTSVIALLVLDAIPLNWAAQAFGLGAAATWLVTGIMLAASVAAMAGLELTREDSRQRGTLLILITVGFAALAVLRSMFLVTVAGESLATAILQAVLLTGISASLVACGSAIMAKTRPLTLARALAAVRRARRASAACRAARREAEAKMQRHWAVLQRALREWSIMSEAPAGVSQADWIFALERAMRALVPEQ
jgi:hypothetical protein